MSAAPPAQQPAPECDAVEGAGPARPAAPRTSVFCYPWDVVGDPEAARRVAGLGAPQVTLASAYHSTRALTPRHPRHRIVTARHAAVLYPPDPDRWSGRRLRPAVQDWVPEPDPYASAATALAGAGLEVHSWVVLAHNTRMGEEHPDTTVRNAYGDRYPWAPCVARPEVRAYLVDLAAEAAVRPDTAGTELESCGWYGLAHLHAHDKIGGVELPGAAQYLMSLCFCEVCETGYAARGLPARRLAEVVRRALEPVWAGRAAATAGRAAERTAIAEALGPEADAVVADWRGGVARTLQREAVAAVRAAAAANGRPGFRVLLHADPAAHRCGANAGVDPADVLAHADGVVAPCAGGTAERADVLRPFAAAARPGATVAANLTVVAGMGGSPATLAADAAGAVALGADQLRLYHVGLAGEEDLAAVRALCAGGDGAG